MRADDIYLHKAQLENGTPLIVRVLEVEENSIKLEVMNDWQEYKRGDTYNYSTKGRTLEDLFYEVIS